jgi:hypothetical protein
VSYWDRQVENLWAEWIAATCQQSGDPADFIEWALSNNRLALRPEAMKQVLRRQVAQVLRQARRYDEEGRFTYRAQQSVTLFDGDAATKHYFDTDKGGTANLRQRSVRQRRDAIAHHVYRGVCDVERMNKVFSDEPQLNFSKDFTDDVAELRWVDRGDDGPGEG